MLHKNEETNKNQQKTNKKPTKNPQKTKKQPTFWGIAESHFHSMSEDLADHLGFTALHVGAQFCRLKVLKVLLEAKADTDKETNEGASALRLAAQNGHHEVVQLLLLSGVAWFCELLFF